MTLVRQAAASEIAVPSGAERETWIHGYRADYWTAAGWITVALVTCCIRMGLVSMWWKLGRVGETMDSGTQTLKEGRCAQNIPTNIMITKHGQGRAWKKRLPMPLEITRSPISELAFSLRPKRRFRKARLEAAHWNMRTSFEPRRCFNEFQYCRRQLAGRERESGQTAPWMTA